MEGPYKVDYRALHSVEPWAVVSADAGVVGAFDTDIQADKLCDALNAAYAAGKADADRGLREAAQYVVREAAQYVVRELGGGDFDPNGIAALRAALAATEPAFAKQLRESVAQLENKP